MILVTGAAGRVGTALRPSLRAQAQLRLTDIRPLPAAGEPGEEFVLGDLTEPDVVAEVVRGATAIIHLAGFPGDTDWPTLLSANIRSTTLLTDFAAAEGIPTVVFASSIHAIGGYNQPATWPVPGDVPPRPCCRYGAAKVACETVFRLYSDQVENAHVTCLRLPLVTYLPRTEFEPRSWLAEEDLARLMGAALASTRRFGIYVGTSICPDPRFDIAASRHDLGYRPEVRADHVPRASHPPAYAPECALWRNFPSAVEPTTHNHKETS